jgi:hypothetical protein
MSLYNTYGIAWKGSSFLVIGRTVPANSSEQSETYEPKKIYNYSATGELLGYYEPPLGIHAYGAVMFDGYLFYCDYGEQGVADGSVKKIELDPTIDTQLQASSVEFKGMDILVRWTLSDISENATFKVFRAVVSSGVFTRVDKGNIIREGLIFSFTDDSAEKDISYRYRVTVLDENDEKVLFETGPVLAPAGTLALYPNYPNPFNPATVIRYDIPERSHVRLEIFDAAGRRLKTLVDDMQEKGPKTVSWNGIDNKGNMLASGVYFSRLTVGKETRSQKLLMLR